MIERNISCSTGEFLVLGELLRKGNEAYLAHNKTQKGWDIVVLKENRNIRVQVKTIDWPNNITINGKFDSGFDVLVIVLLNRAENTRYLIIPQKEISELLSPKNETRKDHNRTLTVRKNYNNDKENKLDKYEANWDNIN